MVQIELNDEKEIKGVDGVAPPERQRWTLEQRAAWRASLELQGAIDEKLRRLYYSRGLRHGIAIGLAFALALAGTVMLFGCASRATTVQERAVELQSWVETVKGLGVEGEIVGIWGTGHAGGVAFNITGSNGFWRIKVEPPTSQPVTP